MKHLIPRCQLFERNTRRIASRGQLPELSDWLLRDIGIFRRPPALEAVKPFWMN